VSVLANCIHVMTYNSAGLNFNVICEETCDLIDFARDPCIVMSGEIFDIDLVIYSKEHRGLTVSYCI